jgi:hypothetical protein
MYEHYRHRLARSSHHFSFFVNESQTSNMEQFFDSIADGLGIPSDYARLLFCLGASIPLSLPLPHLPSTLKHCYNMVTSFIFLYVILQLHYGFLQLAFMSLATYTLSKLGSQGRLDNLGFQWPWLVFGLCMGELAIAHTYRYVADVSLDVIEISGEFDS